MRSLDDALPAAKAGHATVSAVRSRQSEAEGGAAFRKTFADLGPARDTGAKSHISVAQAKPRPDEPANVTPSDPSVPAAQAGTSDAAQPRASGIPGLMPSEAEGKSEQAPHAAVARGTPAATAETSGEPSTAPTVRTDALALLSIVTAEQLRDADGETVDLPPTSADEPIENRPVPPTKMQATAVGEHIEGQSKPAGNPEKASAATPSTTADTRPSAAATLSATLALKAIKADPEAARAENVAASATAPADEEKKVAAGKSLDTQTPAARLRVVMPERTAEASTVSSGVPQKSASAAILTNASKWVTAADESVAGSEPAMQALASEKARVTQPSDAVEDVAEKVSAQDAESPLQRPTRQATTEMPPEPAEEPAEAPAPVEEVDIRSLMAILGPVVAQPVVGASAKTENVKAKLDAEAGMPGLKLGGDRINMPIAMAAADTSPLPASTDGADQVFRFARADGKSSPISLRADADRPTSKSSNDQANTKAETVTVLDARRYLGIAPTLGNQLPMTANAQAVAAAITGNGDPTQALQTSTGIAGPHGATGKVVNTLKIQMHPIDLGLVTATLRLRDDELQIDLRVQTGDAYRQLTNDQDGMIKALRAQGFQVDQVNIIFTPQDSAAGNDNSGMPQGNQQQPSQNGRDSQGGLAAGNGGEGRNGGAGQRNADDGRTRQDTLRETPAAPQPGLSDELYL
ncbi:hook-length control protein FliK [Rhizobium sp. NFR03]|nr:hook-length control protein FliK [Rhizobium sp. NFR03]